VKKKLAVLAILLTFTILFSGFQSSMFYGTEYMTSKPSYLFTVDAAYTWWDCNWSYCKKITIDHTKVESDQVNFPVLLYEATDSDLASHAQPDGGDIIFVNQWNSTQYKHEIETFDSSTGELYAWVNVTSLSSTSDTILYMYYGNPTCTNQWNITQTWESDYIMVQHLNESSGSLQDSTINEIDGTNNGATYNSTGKIEGGYDFDGNDNITATDNSSLDITEEITLEGWVKDPPLSSGFTNDTRLKILDKKDEQIKIAPGQ
jgi:hypothetical protein